MNIKELILCHKVKVVAATDRPDAPSGHDLVLGDEWQVLPLASAFAENLQVVVGHTERGFLEKFPACFGLQAPAFTAAIEIAYVDQAGIAVKVREELLEENCVVAVHANAPFCILQAEGLVDVDSQIDGAFGLNGMYVGVPAILGAGGVERVVNIRMTADEQAMFDKSVDAVKGLLAACKAIDPSLA